MTETAAAVEPAPRYVWRPSMFAPRVSHLTREGDTAYTSDRYPGERWVYAACGQNTSVDGVPAVGSVKCPECVLWLQENGDTPAATR